MAEPFLGEIRMFGFNFAPQGWAMCNGQLLPINQNTALFSLLGTTYGGNGTTTFQLPNLQGSVAMHMGNSFVLGAVGGSADVTLLAGQMPTHNHLVAASTGLPNSKSPASNFLAPAARNGPFLYSTSETSPANLAAGTITDAGGSQPFSVLQPYLVLNFCIALQGIFPSRN
jgi:microcystin-dependent protein